MQSWEPMSLDRQGINYSNIGIDLDPGSARYFQMKLIRIFEEELMDLFAKNELSGTTHTCMGQEGVAVGVLSAIDRDKDMIWSNHRCHGHFLAYCGEVDGLMAEIMGRETGVCGGRGGSQHLHWRNFSSSGVQGGFLPAAVGAAFAERASQAISCVFLGDGTMGEGVLYEALNLAALRSAPVLFVVEDNGIAQTTPRAQGVAGSITERAAAFGVRTAFCESFDADEIAAVAEDLAAFVRTERRPAWLHLRTWRIGPHSKGDDTRPSDEIQQARRHDPVALYRPRVKRAEQLDALCRAIVDRAVVRAREARVACG
jgi:TPP-dependent pyruvate/acetoin dehydrogenase alpha subunit